METQEPDPDSGENSSFVHPFNVNNAVMQMSIVSCVDNATGTLHHGNKAALGSYMQRTVISMTTSLKVSWLPS